MKILRSFILVALFVPFIAAQTSPPATTDTTTSSSSSSTSTSSTSSTTSTTSSTTSTSSSTSSQTTSATSPINTPPPNTTQNAPGVSTITSGGTTYITTDSSTTTSGTATAPTTSTTDKSDQKPEDDEPGLGTGSIVGLSVAAGVAVIGIIAFFVWKFTRKRFTDLEGEPIKWPELNTGHAGADTQPLPSHTPGRFDTSDGDLSRINSSSNYSTPDFHTAGGQDPYAVPPLPHLNPNQPYRDDPGLGNPYYDPYHGPVPGTLDPHAPDWNGTEAIPMNQMSGRASPGPIQAYGAPPQDMYQQYDQGQYDHGRQSPYVGGPQQQQDPYYGGGRQSPGPQAAYGGRASPGPQTAYGR